MRHLFTQTNITYFNQVIQPRPSHPTSPPPQFVPSHASSTSMLCAYIDCETEGINTKSLYVKYLIDCSMFSVSIETFAFIKLTFIRIQKSSMKATAVWSHWNNNSWISLRPNSTTMNKQLKNQLCNYHNIRLQISVIAGHLLKLLWKLYLHYWLNITGQYMGVIYIRLLRWTNSNIKVLSSSRSSLKDLTIRIDRWIHFNYSLHITNFNYWIDSLLFYISSVSCNFKTCFFFKVSSTSKNTLFFIFIIII